MKKFEIYAISAFIVAISGLIITLLTVAIQGHFTLFGSINFNKISSVGSFISGIVGSFFSIATVLLIWLTYKSQKEELQKTSQIAENQYNLVQKQNFESTFFNLLKMFTDCVEQFNYATLDEYGEEVIVKGREAITIIYLKKFLKSPSLNESEYKKLFYNELSYFLDFYLQLFKQLVNFIDKHPIEKALYVEILKNATNDYEKCLIFYHCLIMEEMKDFKEMLIKYNFFEGMNKKRLENENHYNLFSEKK